LKLQGIWFPGAQKRNEQGSDRSPAQKVKIGQGKDQNLQTGREQHQQPRALVHPPHLPSITKCSFAIRPSGDSRPRLSGGAKLRCSCFVITFRPKARRASLDRTAEGGCPRAI